MYVHVCVLCVRVCVCAYLWKGEGDTTDILPNTLTRKLLNFPEPTHLAPWVLVKHTQHGQLGCHCFAATCGSTKQHTVVGVEHRVEDLRLYGVEVVKGEQILVLVVL